MNFGGKMFKKSKLILLLAALLPAFAMIPQAAEADEIEEQTNVEKKYKLSVCALFKNEAAYLREWLEYHQLVGVDHFYLYDNGSRDRSSKVLTPYIKQGLVTFLRWPDRMPNTDDENATHWALSTQLTAYGNAIRRFAINESEWLVFLDVDEYLVPVQANSVCEVLENYKGCPGLDLTCDFFDAADKGSVAKKELLIANADLTSRPAQNILKSVEKTLFKPEQNTSFTWPPYKCNFKDGKTARKVSRSDLRINKYVNRSKGDPNFSKIKQRVRVDSRALSENEKTELLEIGYQIEDKERVINRFEPGLRKRLGIESGWKIINE